MRHSRAQRRAALPRCCPVCPWTSGLSDQVVDRPRLRRAPRPSTTWGVANTLKFEELQLDVKGETDEELAASLVAEMLRTGLTAKG